MKKCVVISDSFKGTLSSLEICRIARSSVPKFFPDCELLTLPVADGGEGTVECFLETVGARPVKVRTTGPYGEDLEAVYARMGSKAVIEMACAAGLPIVGEKKNPEKTTSFGVGTVIRHAVESGCTEILLGLGGSATNDGGCGCAAALDCRFSDANGEKFIPTGETLAKIAHIDRTGTERLLEDVKVTVMCDVENPLYGENGAAFVFAPQKGADKAMTARLDRGLRSLSGVIEKDLGILVSDMPGSGAAGGMGAGCVAFLGAELKSGIKAILDMVEFDRCIESADLVITGEGRIDFQSVQGKVISGIAKHTALKHIPLIALVGAIDESAETAYDLGVTAMFGIDREAADFTQYAHRSGDCYRRTLEDILRLVKAVKQGSEQQDHDQPLQH